MVERLVTFLGTGEYQETEYFLNQERVKTCYVAQALSTFLKPQQVVTFATDQAWEKHGDRWIQSLKEAGVPHSDRIPV